MRLYRRPKRSSSKSTFGWSVLKIVLAASFLAVLSHQGNSLDWIKVGAKQTQSNTQHVQVKKSEVVETLGPPTLLKIPKINVDTTVEQVSLTGQGAMGAPTNIDNVGWFNMGPRPGEKGNAVLAGHVDGKHGEKAVFSNLSKLEKGDIVHLEDSQGTVTTFIVRESRMYDPGHADEVFSPSDGAHLNLITCAGVWDKTKESYTKRLVVFTDIKQ